MLERVLDRLDETQLIGVASAMANLRMAVTETIVDPGSGAHHSHQPQGRD
jgi:hypothetical protein